MRRSLVISLVGIVVVAVASLVATLAAGNSPELGLDLQGGAAVTLRPNRDVSDGILNQSIEIIRSRVDALGVAEPDIARQGDAIVVQLPGVRDQERALAVVGQTAELRFRPVLEANLPEDTATTPREEDQAEATVVLPELDRAGDVVARYRLGPTIATGEIVDSARAVAPTTGGNWDVALEFTDDGSKKWDELAAANYQKQVAIVLDGVVKSAPVIQQQEFGGSAEITGTFTEREARDLALVLRYGALPVQLEPQTVQRVSATLGNDSLQAGLVAGLVGLGLVLVYMMLYYRALGLVVLLGLALSAALLWSFVSLLGETSGLALSLAGTVGIIVSVGVTVDSYVVYFERLKDEIRSGKTVRSSVDRGFQRAYRTIVAADVSSLIGAGLLYWLTVGPVRGFAFFLGLSALLDLIVAYFFTRPMVVLLGRNRFFTEARWFGVARGLAVAPGGGGS